MNVNLMVRQSGFWQFEQGFFCPALASTADVLAGGSWLTPCRHTHIITGMHQW
jgi:hypothetical protein